MNSYELAKYVETREINNKHLNEAGKMLRQQTKRIEELEKALSRALDLLEVSRGEK